MSSKKHFMVIDPALCEDCGSCYLACKDEYSDNTFPGYSAKQPRNNHAWIKLPRNERGHGSLIDVVFRPHICMHCAEAPCTTKAKNNAISRRPDGVVLIDPIRAKMQPELVKMCPYDAIVWNDAEKLPQKCTLCAHLLDDGWKTTRCAQVCPTGALRLEYMTDEERSNLIKSQELEAYKPNLKTGPLTLYKNLYRFTKAFIAGSVAMKSGDKVDCVKGAKIVLKRKQTVLASIFTDNYGDFKFDKLDENSGQYTLDIIVDNKIAKSVNVELNKSVYIENIKI
ncbi:4Fe-4S dicluster domain-containing protein [Geobacter sp. AOG2]|uniref:4Fe-4S dicluster domain-containing protein n=1 Tax=Geobacter sp. AOG2 TaxID=1566347 RepID=UPI001CC72562|nr:4Fe-4S dicluster domain-containing protein [Geobacter sp. AOG2]GFE59625.1 oxidoreductase [Geobacter sp. AOG2]